MTTDRRPARERAFLDDGSQPMSWADARRRLAEANTYWVATGRPGGGPHLVPVLAVWTAGDLHFAAGRRSVKARNLARDPRCVIGTSRDSVDLVVEGTAARVRDGDVLAEVVRAYAIKYDWPVTIVDGALHGDGAPTAGPPPYDVYRVVPDRIFALPGDESTTATRWEFGAVS